MKRQRTAAKPYGELRVELNRLGTSVDTALQRQGKKLKSLSRAEQHKCAGQMLSGMEGQIRNIVYKQDSTRILQQVIKYGSTKQRKQICKELRGKFIDLSEERYAHQSVLRLLEFGKEEVRSMIVREVLWACTRTLFHRIACKVTDYAVMVAATPQQKRQALQCFLSKKFAKEPVMEQDDPTMPCTMEAILTSATLRKKEKRYTVAKCLNPRGIPSECIISHAVPWSDSENALFLLG